jgi:hypothetical protein
MALTYKDRVMAVTATTGTGSFTMGSAVTGYQAWSVVGDANTAYYSAFAVDTNGNPTGDWEVGLGTYASAGTTLARTTVLASSNGGSAVSFSAGTKRVALVQPASAISPGVTDHGALTGLSDDDHTIYELTQTFNVLRYGAIGDGIANDAAAIQLAIDAAFAAGGGVVFFPAGTYKVSGAGTFQGINYQILNLKSNVTLKGVRGRREVVADDWLGSVIDARDVHHMANATCIVGTAAAGADNVGIEGLSFRGAGGNNDTDANEGGWLSGIFLYGARNSKIENVYIASFGENIVLRYLSHSKLIDVFSTTARNSALSMWGVSGVDVRGGGYANSGRSPNEKDGDIFIGRAADGTRSRAVTVSVPLLDEGGHACMNIEGADGVTVVCPLMYFSGENANGTGPGYGYKLGNGTVNPTRVTIIGTRVKPFTTGAATNTLLIHGSDHCLVNVSTDPDGGGDISDDSTGTTRMPIIGQTLTITGPTVARTITIPDADFTVARKDAAETFAGALTITAGNLTLDNGSFQLTSGGAVTQLAGSFMLIGTIGYVTSPADGVWRFNNTSNTGGQIEFLQIADIGTPSSNAARIAAEDVAGTAEIIVADEAGTETQISSHAMDGPEWLYDADDPFPRVKRDAQRYVGVIRWTNESRMARLTQLSFTDPAAMAALTVQQKICVHQETLAEFESRTGKVKPKRNWQADQDRKQAEHDAARDKELAQHKKWAASQDPNKGKAPEVRPAGSVKKSMPKWLRNLAT